MLKQTQVNLLGKIKKESTRNKTKPFRYRFGGFIDKYFSTLDEAKAFQRDFSEKEARLGVDTAKLFESPELLKASERAFSILRDKGIDAPEALVDAVKRFVGTLPPKGYTTTLEQAIEALRENPDYKDKASVTLRDYNRYSAEILKFFGPNKTFSSLTSMDWQAYLNECRKTSNHAHNKAFRHVSLFYGRYWIPMGYATKNPLRDGPMIPRKAKHTANFKEIYSHKEIEAIKAAASADTSDMGQRNYMAFIVQAYTGIRGEELEKLTFGMFCDRSSSFHMRPKRLIMTLPSTITKKGDYRQIEICCKLRYELFLLPYFKKHLTPVIEENEDGEPRYGFHMRNTAINERCYPVKITQFRRTLRSWCIKAQVPYKSNNLRATYTSHALFGLFGNEANPDLALQRSLGHRMGSTVTEHNYFHQVDPDDALAYFDDGHYGYIVQDLFEEWFQPK
ncbi:MAG: tyrosine-type recombinase/integrase [Coraliomargaritaceae bacterium]